jgi:hypothetical protein
MIRQYFVFIGAFPNLICVCVSQTQIEKKWLSRSRLPPRVKKPVANCKYLWFSVYVESLILGITNICDLLPISTDVTYNHLLGRNPYIFKRPKRQRRAFPLAFFHRLLLGSYWLLLKGLGWTRLRGTVDFSTLWSWDCERTRRARLLFPFYWHFVLMAPIPPSRRHRYQFRADELNDFLDIVESFLPISAQNWQAVADIHLELSPGGTNGRVLAS